MSLISRLRAVVAGDDYLDGELDDLHMAEIDTLEYNRFSDVNSLDPTALGEAITEMAIAIYDTVVWSDRTFPALMRNIVELECYKESR